MLETLALGGCDGNGSIIINRIALGGRLNELRKNKCKRS